MRVMAWVKIKFSDFLAVLYDSLFVLGVAGGAVVVVSLLRKLLASKVFSINLSGLASATPELINSAYSSLLSFYILSAVVILAYYVLAVFLHAFFGLLAWGAVCSEKASLKGVFRLFVFYLVLTPFALALIVVPSYFFSWHIFSFVLLFIAVYFSFFFKRVFLQSGKIFSSFRNAFALFLKVHCSFVFYVLLAVFAVLVFISAYFHVVVLLFIFAFLFVLFLRKLAGGLK
jgi:hypothetical protein